MKFFWPAPLDQIDPSYNFAIEEGKFSSAKHKQQRYPHEVFDHPPYDGFVISKIYVDQGKNCRWNSSQLNRFLREGARRFLKIPSDSTLKIMGDCGSFTRGSNEQAHRSIIDECLEVIEYYTAISVDFGLAPDTLIGHFVRRSSDRRKENLLKNWDRRVEKTIKQASSFWTLCRKRQVRWDPIGVAQGWDLSSYQRSITSLQEIGYSYIAIGGLARLQSRDIIDILKACYSVKHPSTNFHLLGVGRIEHIKTFEKFGVLSFDSSAAVRQAISDDKRNYHFVDKDYLAIRIPQTYKSPRLKDPNTGAKFSQEVLLKIELESLNALRVYAKGELELWKVLDILKKGIEYRKEKDFLKEYEQLLKDMPWNKCPCPVCKQAGIEVVLLRNRERNLRRGFHNLFIFYNSLQTKLGNPLNDKLMPKKEKYLSIPAIAFSQGTDTTLFTFAIEGSKLNEFASVSRISRKDDREILGYQRPEVVAHISNITKYLLSDNSMLPNSIVLAFDNVVQFEPLKNNESLPIQMGTLKIPIDPGQKGFTKPAWIVDGQQRTAALKEAQKKNFHVSVVGFIAKNFNEHREQFMLVNSTKPLAKALLYELLPHTNCILSDSFEKRRFPSVILEKLNYDENSPFFKKIKTATNPKGIVQDNSILKMLENSLADGALYFIKENTIWKDGTDLLNKILQTLTNFWTAVSETFEPAWKLPPTKSRLTHGAGIVSLGFIMDAIVDRNISNEPLATSVFKNDLAKLAPICRWTYGHWEFGPGAQRKWNGIQNTPTDVRMLSHYLLLQYKSLVWNDAIRYS